MTDNVNSYSEAPPASDDNKPSANIGLPESKTTPAKHIFLDVVSFTHKRSVEAQSEIVHNLNRIVETSLDELSIDREKIIFLPTGDGICIALLNIEEPYDVHVEVATGIIRGVHRHSQVERDEMRRFSVRIGINANIDNIVTDINKRKNLAGAGINMAARIMNTADGNQIIVGESVFDTLRDREKYMHSFKSHVATVKHGLTLRVYQLVDAKFVGLNTETPKEFEFGEKPQDRKLPPFSQKIAYYLALLIKYKSIVIAMKEDDIGLRYLKLVLWLTAQDELKTDEKEDFMPDHFLTYKFRQAEILEQVDHYRENLDIKTLLAFDREIGDQIPDRFSIFEHPYELIATPGAEVKLRSEKPELCRRLGI